MVSDFQTNPCMWPLRLLCTIHPLGDLSMWPACGDGAGGRADGRKRQYDLCGLQTSVWPDQWEHWRCLPAAPCRCQQGEAHVHTLVILLLLCLLKQSSTETFSWPSQLLYLPLLLPACLGESTHCHSQLPAGKEKEEKWMSRRGDEQLF